MTRLNFSLNPYPITTSLGGISWLKPLRKGESSGELTRVERSYPGQKESVATLVGELENYGLYFLASRARVRLVPMEGDGGPYIVLKQKDGVLVAAEFKLQADVVTGVVPPTVKARLRMTPGLEALLQKARGTNQRIAAVALPKDALFSNALRFDFAQDGTSIPPLAANITPDLTRFIELDANDPGLATFVNTLHYRIHYIGQTTTSIEDRLEQHNKIRILADLLLTKELDQEPVVFAFSHQCSHEIDAQLSLDLVEAALISQFKPPLNSEHLHFPAAKMPKEIHLRKRLQVNGIKQVEVAPVNFSHPNASGKMLLDWGLGFTYSGDGSIFMKSVHGANFIIP